MKKIFWVFAILLSALFSTESAFARCQYWGPPINQYRCLPDKPGQAVSKKKGTASDNPAKPAGGCSQLDLTISCAASGSAVDWANTCSLDCGDGNRYDALAVQQDKTTLKCWHREVPPNRSCSVSVGSGFDSKVVGSVQTRGSCKQLLHGQCAW
ncbi:MAG: hypothetical protein Q7T03_01045 [Deltaproteobacteria bacterium]|nr:hypothetical protein [Deltaproteobacteria bacterium]